MGGDSISKFVEDHPYIEAGDLLYFHNVHEPNQDVTHATIISEVKDCEIFYAGHSGSRDKFPLSEAIVTTEEDDDFLYDYVYIIKMSDALWLESV